MAMVADAERTGHLRPGGTIIEATAGNTGIGLAMVAAVKGYRCVFVLPDKMSSEKIALLRAYGAEVVITATAVAPDSPDSYNGVADRLAREIPGAWRPNQFGNLSNPEVHYRTTGPEVWEQTDGKVTVLVAGVGTGGTISGVGRNLKERNPAVRVVGADPAGSVLSGGAPHGWKVEGIGEDFVPRTFNGQVVDDWVRVTDAESFHAAREMARREGILVGGSCGTAVAAALLLRKKGVRPLLSVGPGATAADAIAVLQAAGISQLPVMDGGTPVGSVQEVTLARVLHDHQDPAAVSVAAIMARPLPQLDIGTHLDEAYRLLLSGNTGVLATHAGAAVGIVTRIDLIDYWTTSRNGAA